MATMKEIIDAEIAKNLGVELTLELHDWSEPGIVVYGKMLGYEPFTGGEFSTECQRYTFETDEGRKSMVLGSVGDRALADPVNVGKMFRITFKGKKEGKKGKMFNDFSIICVPSLKTK